LVNKWVSIITKLDAILKKLFSSTLDIIICGDININYLTDNARKRKLEALLKTYHLTSIVNFPTRTQKKSATAIDNIFIDATRIGNYTIYPIINGLSDHDAQSITFHAINSKPPTLKQMLIRRINEYTINDFLLKLSYETWDTVFSSNDDNVMFSSFIDSYLTIFYSSFPLKKVSVNKIIIIIIIIGSL